MKNSVIEKVYEANDIDVPEVMIENEIDNMISEFEQSLKGQGMELNSYLEYFGKDAADFRKELREEALKKTKTRMIVSAVAEQEKLEASEEDITAEFENMAKQYGLEADKIREMIGVQNIGMIAGDIRMRKAVEFMYDSAVKK